VRCEDDHLALVPIGGEDAGGVSHFVKRPVEKLEIGDADPVAGHLQDASHQLFDQFA
jgi:hypothetical protein